LLGQAARGRLFVAAAVRVEWVASTPTDVVLDAIALVEARLRGDDEGLSTVLNHCGNHRAVAVVLADAFARFLRHTTADPLAALPQVRQTVIAGGSPPATC
jgi:hypothetical protein